MYCIVLKFIHIFVEENTKSGRHVLSYSIYY